MRAIPILTVAVVAALVLFTRAPAPTRRSSAPDEPAAVAAAPSAPAPAESPPPTPAVARTYDRLYCRAGTGGFDLEATLVSDWMGFALASVRDGERERLVRSGDRLSLGRVHHIEPGRLYLDGPDGPACVSLGRRHGEVPAPARASGPEVTRTGEGRYTVSRAWVEGSLAELGALSGEAHARLVRRGERLEARLVSIRPGGKLERLGLRAGDVLRAVDGAPIRSLNEILRLVDRVGELRGLTLGLVRRGRPLELAYTLE